MEEFALINFHRNSGKILTILHGKGMGLLKLWAVQNTTRATDTIVFNMKTGEIIGYYEGKPDFPKITVGGNIEWYCKGLLEELRK